MRFSALMPFFATLVMAAAFFYYQYNNTKFKLVDFEKLVFYGKDYIFAPTKDEYLVLLYNSKVSNFSEVAKSLPDAQGVAILAIDYYQNRNQNAIDNITPLSAGMNTLLAFSKTFRAYKIPAYFRLKRVKNSTFMQDSKVKEIAKFNKGQK